MSFQKARDLIDNTLLFNKIIEFNQKFNATDESSESVSQEHLFLKEKDESLFIFKKREHEGIFIPFYAEPDRLCLVDKDTLQKLSLYLGSCILYKSLLNILFKKDKEILFSFLDRDIYDFALTFGRFSVPGALIVTDIIDIDSLHEAIVSHGCACLSSLASLMTDERLKKHFTATIGELGKSSFEVVDDEHARALYKVCIRILTQEIDKTWLKYFA